jgi:hypothetical protein
MGELAVEGLLGTGLITRVLGRRIIERGTVAKRSEPKK